MTGRRTTLGARLHTFGPMCRAYGHVFIQRSFFGFPIGRPYCMRCGRRADA